MDRNIAAVHHVRTVADQNRRRDQKFVDDVAAFAGSTTSLYVHFVIYGLWLSLHFIAKARGQDWGASLENISLAASLEAIFLAVFVLINQRRMNAMERKNSNLHLQMSMLAEHEVTRLAQMTDLIAKKLGVNTAGVKDLENVKQDVSPTEILEKISDHEKKCPTDSGTT